MQLTPSTEEESGDELDGGNEPIWLTVVALLIGAGVCVWLSRLML